MVLPDIFLNHSKKHLLFASHPSANAFQAHMHAATIKNQGELGKVDFLPGRPGKCLLQIIDDIVNVLDADGQANQVRRQTARPLLLFI